MFFQWPTDTRLEVLKATRPQVELYIPGDGEAGLGSDHRPATCHPSSDDDPHEGNELVEQWMVPGSSVAYLENASVVDPMLDRALSAS